MKILSVLRSVRSLYSHLIILSFWALSITAVQGESQKEYSNLHPFSALGTNMWDSITGWRNAALFSGGVGSTLLLVHTGWDRDVQNWSMREDPLGYTIPVGMYWAGIFVQPAIGVGMYLGGHLADHHELIGGGSAVLQALGITGLYTMALKYTAGRTRPGCCNSANEFEFRPWKRDILTARQSWPSGHTSATFVLVSTLHAYYDRPIFAWIGHPFAILMGLSMVDWDYHWFSDTFAGAAIGAMVGYAVGYNFRRMLNNREDVTTGMKDDSIRRFVLAPMLSPDGAGILMTYIYD